MNLPTAHDAMFDELRGAVPLQFLRALAWMESGLDASNKTGKQWGLFQAGPANLADYNAAKGTSYGRDYLLDARVNTQVFLWELARIMRSLSAGGLPPDWGDDDYVKLVAMAWNAGWSKAKGVRHVLDYLRGKGLPFTHDTVRLRARESGAAATLSSPAKATWQRGVAALYRQLERAPRDPIPAPAAAKLAALKTAAKGAPVDWLWLALLLGAIYLTHRQR